MKPSRPGSAPIGSMPGKNEAAVYSTGEGRLCPGCGRPVAGCLCRKKESAPRGDGIVRIGRQTKGCKGKGLTVITGLPLGPDDLEELARRLKQRCGAGGTVKDGVVEIQGDHRELLMEELQKQGYKVKRAGG